MNKELIWLLNNARFLKVYHIEDVLGMSEGTLKKFIDGKRNLPEKWHKPVIEWVKKFRAS